MNMLQLFNLLSMSTWVVDSFGFMNKAAVNITYLLMGHLEHTRWL